MSNLDNDNISRGSCGTTKMEIYEVGMSALGIYIVRTMHDIFVFHRYSKNGHNGELSRRMANLEVTVSENHGILQNLVGQFLMFTKRGQ